MYFLLAFLLFHALLSSLTCAEHEAVGESTWYLQIIKETVCSLQWGVPPTPLPSAWLQQKHRVLLQRELLRLCQPPCSSRQGVMMMSRKVRSHRCSEAILKAERGKAPAAVDRRTCEVWW